MIRIIKTSDSVPLIQKVTIIISLAFLLLSFTQPAFYIDWEENPAAWADSWLLFFFGWTFPLGGAIIPFLIWCANPLYLISIYGTIKEKAYVLYLSIFSTFIALSFSQLDSVITSESGRHSKISSLELGYKFWLISLSIMTVGTGINLYLQKTNRKLDELNI